MTQPIAMTIPPPDAAGAKYLLDDYCHRMTLRLIDEFRTLPFGCHLIGARSPVYDMDAHPPVVLARAASGVGWQCT